MAGKLDYLTTLQSLVRQAHDCEAVHCETVAVHEKFDGRTVWQGDVEVFNLVGHREAKKCYAWFYHEEGQSARFITVLGRSLINSPEAAVRSAIFFNRQPAPYSNQYLRSGNPQKPDEVNEDTGSAST